MTTLIRAGVLAALLAIASPVHADEDVSVSDVIIERANAHNISASMMLRLADCESRMDPRAVGKEGEVGLMQLHPRGLLPEFFRLGYGNPWSAWQQSDFTARMLADGLGRHWSCWWTRVAGRRPPWWS